MGIPTKLLRADESVAVDLHPHWSLLVRPVLAISAAIGLGVAVLVVTDGGDPVRTLGGVVVVGLLVAAIAWLSVRYLSWSSTRFVVTDDRIIQRSGVVARHGVEIPLERINAVHLRQSALQRLVGSGQLLVDVGGDTGRQRFDDIRHPARVQRAIHRQLDENDRRRLASPDRGPSGELAHRLQQLDGLRARGTLTDEEFVAQKRRLLEQW